MLPAPFPTIASASWKLPVPGHPQVFELLAKNTATLYPQDSMMMYGDNQFHPLLKAPDIVTQIILEYFKSGAWLQFVHSPIGGQ